MGYTSPSSGDTFVISNAKSGTALDLKTDGVVIGFKKHAGDNQRWLVQQQPTGKWTFRNKRDGKYLGVEGDKAGDNKQVIAQNHAFEWHMNVDHHLSDSEKGFRIYAHPCFNLDLDGGKSEDGTRVTTWGQWTEEQGAAPHQSWRFEKV